MVTPAALKREINRLLRKLERTYLKKKADIEQCEKELVLT